MNICSGMELAQVLVLIPYLVRHKAHTLRETFAGMFACLGNGSIGTKLVKNPAMIRSGLKLKAAIMKGNFVGILALPKASFFYGMELVHLNVLNP